MKIKEFFDVDILSNKISDYIITNANIADEIQRDNVQYGVSVFMYNLSKLPVIFLLAYYLGIIQYTIVALLSFGFIRTSACGLHAQTSLTCLIYSIMILLGIPLVSVHIIMPTIITFTIFIYSFILAILFAPADTEEKPIASMKLRRKLKIAALVSIFISFLITFAVSPIYANVITLSVFVECTLTTPLLYRIFKKRYNNYKYL